MKFQQKHVLPALCGVILAFSLALTDVFATTPGVDDPVVTKSYVEAYVEKRINESLGNSSTGTSSSYAGEISEYQMEFIIDEVTKNLKNSGVSSSSYTPVSLKAGEIILGEEGTEIILRSGQATGYTIGIAGLANVTTGGEIDNGTTVGINNLLITPRGDGRGIKAESDIWVLVKGGYFIID